MKITAKLSHHRMLRVVALGLGFVATASGCVGVEGVVKLSGGPLGEREFKPDTCKSGHRHGFFGVDLYDGGAPYDSEQASGGYQPYKIGPYVRLVPTGTQPLAESAQQGRYMIRVANDLFHGPLVRVYDPSLAQGYVDFTPEVCQQLHVGAEESSQRFPVMNGIVQLRCALADGTKAVGMLRFFSCY